MLPRIPLALFALAIAMASVAPLSGQETASKAAPTAEPTAAPTAEPTPAPTPTPAPNAPSTATMDRTATLIASLTVFVLAVFVGFEIITKVPPTLHTPLMSGSNAISGITIVGALLVTGGAAIGASRIWGLIAVVLATINVVGGFLVTHRMLAMFSKPRR